MRCVKFIITAAMVAMVPAGRGFATPIDIVNADFETAWTSASLNPNGVALGGVTGWYSLAGGIGWTAAGSASAGMGYFDGPAGGTTNLSPTSTSGAQYAFINGTGPETLTQILDAKLAAGTYTLSVDCAHFGDTPAGSGAPNQYSNEVAQLYAGSTMLTATSSVIPDDPGAKAWARKSWTFVIASDNAILGQTLSIAFTVIGNGGQGDFDNAALSYTPIPEPSSLVLTGMGLLGLFAYAWRKRK